MVSQYIPLILVLMHFIIRRNILDLLPCFLATVAVSAVFYFLLILIPVTKYGSCVTNKFYLGAIVFAFTVFSVQYRLRPALKAGDSNLLLFAVLSLPAFGIYSFFTMRSDLFTLFITNCVLSAVMYLFLRQFAVFESKYQHSISRSSVPLKQLRKQNYITGIFLAEFFLILFLALTIVPLLMYSDIIQKAVLSILPLLITAFFAFINILGSLFLGDDTVVGPEGENYLREQAEDSPLTYIFAYLMAIVFLIVVIHIIPKTICTIIQSAPKFRKITSTSDDGIIVDTIEDINPDKKVRSAKHHDFGTGYERKIRKKFYNKTRHAINDGLPVSSSSTPGQIETVLLANGDTDISELRPEYEHIRYGK